MGLDMYLNARQFMSPYLDDKDGARINKINKMFDLKKVDHFDRPIAANTVIFEIAYWRKANAIHAWFVQNVQDGKDECQASYVSREKLQELLDLCKEVLEHRGLAPKLLPSTNGFFFGSTVYDDWYFDNIKFTAKRLDYVLNDPRFKRMEFEYQASW